MAGKEAIEVARAKRDVANTDNTFELPDGRRGKVIPVSASIIEEAARAVKAPRPPKVFIEDKGREEENPNDPEYLLAIDEYERARGVAIMDVMVMLGLELIDGLPEDDAWLTKLRFLSKRGQINLDDYDLDDPIEREFVYKRFVISPSWVLTKITEASGISPEEVDSAEATFPGS